MKPSIFFLGGCEFSALIDEICKNVDEYIDFKYFSSFDEYQSTDAYSFVQEHGEIIIEADPDVIVLSQFNRLARHIDQIQHNMVSSKEQQDQQLENIISQAKQMILKLSKEPVPILMQYLPWPRTGMLNIYKPNADIYNESQFLRKYITAMEELAADYANFSFMDMTQICSYYGFNRTLKMTDPPWFSHPVSPASHIAQEFTRWLNYVLRRGNKIKCVLVDLDNTMWEGVIRDVGIDGINIRIDKERFRWNVLQVLNARGILIGVISKNDAHLESDIKSFVGDYMRAIDFVCFDLSWDDKWTRLRKTQERLNIGLDSILFIDDNEFERAQMRAMLPEVMVADENVFEQLLYLPQLHPEHITNESKNRAKYYKEQINRAKAQAEQTMSRDDFLKSCGFKIRFKEAEPFEINRITELVQRTNQLNTSIKRYSKEQIVRFTKDHGCDVSVVHLQDNFGDYGLVGVCIGFDHGNVYEIDTLLFSCRVMSKGVEDYTLTRILEIASNRNFENVLICFKKGDKNTGMQRILEHNFFKKDLVDNEKIVYSFDLRNHKIKPFPAWFCPTQENVYA